MSIRKGCRTCRYQRVQCRLEGKKSLVLFSPYLKIGRVVARCPDLPGPDPGCSCCGSVNTVNYFLVPPFIFKSARVWTVNYMVILRDLN